MKSSKEPSARYRLRLLVRTLLLWVVFVLPSAVPIAGQGQSPQLSLSPDSAPAGASVTATGSGFPEASDGRLLWADRSPIGSFTTDPTGSFVFEFTVPAVEPGTYVLVADVSANDGSVQAEASLTVEAPDETPPATETAEQGQPPTEQAETDAEPTTEPAIYPIVASDQSDNGPDADVLHDGDLSTYWITEPVTPDDAFVSLDLGESRPISSLRLLLASAGTLATFEIQLSEEGSTWGSLGSFNGATLAAGVWFEQPVNVWARYVRISMSNPDGLPQLGGIAEIEVWPAQDARPVSAIVTPGAPEPTEAGPAATSAPTPVITGHGTIGGTGGVGAYCYVAQDASSTVIGVLPDGSAVDLTGDAANGWQPVLCEGQTAYIGADFVVPVTPANTPTEQPVKTPVSGEETVIQEGTEPASPEPEEAPDDTSTSASADAAVQASAAQGIVFDAVADTEVDADNSTANFGSATTLNADGDPQSEIWLQFEVSGLTGPVEQATLRLYVTNGTSDGPSVAASDDSAWSETALSWESKPSTGDPIDNKRDVPPSAYVEFDVLSLVSGDGRYTFVIIADSDDGLYVNSREATSNRPQLVLSATGGGATATVTETPPVVESRSVPAVADAQVREENPNTNYGSNGILRADGGRDPDVESYVKFEVSGLVGSPERVILRLVVGLGTDALSRDGAALFVASSSGWSERDITWSNRPGRSVEPLDDLGRVVRGEVIEFDVTSVITGNGMYTFVLASSSADATDFSSREGANSPLLVINGAFDDASPTPTETEPAESPTATSTATETATATATATQPPLPGDSLTLPIRAAFYYPWFPETWEASGELFTNYTPSLGLYDSSDPAVIANHIDAMQYGNIQAGIASWWGPGERTDDRFPQLLAGAAGTGFRWAVYYEDEGFGNPTVNTISDDLQYLHEQYASDPSYLRLDGRFVVFVYGGAESCAMANRWQEANTVDAYIVLKVFSGYESCGSQPDGWHQYAPASAEQSHPPDSFSISPGFHLSGESSPRLGRDIERWQQNVLDMIASGADWQLITTFNEWGEGTAVESADEWETSSGYGQYLDVLHENGSQAPPSTATATPSPTLTLTQTPGGDSAILLAAGDIASCGSNGDEQTAAILDSQAGTVATLGDNVYPDGTARQFAECYDPSWGRHRDRTRPSVGNHEYHTSGASGYYTYFGAAAGDPDEGYYSYELGEWHVIVLNSNIARSASSVQVQWLIDDLEANSAACTLAYWHHPLFNSGEEHGNDSSIRPFYQVLYDYGAEVVLTGHEHTYERFAPQTANAQADPQFGIRQFVVGTGGASHYDFGSIQPNSQVRNGDTYGVLKVVLNPGGYTWEFLPVEGESFTDSGSGTCHDAPPSQSTVDDNGLILFAHLPVSDASLPAIAVAILDGRARSGSRKRDLAA